MYAIGDKIVYPMHGAGIVEKIEEKEILGELRKYYVLKVPCGDMKIMIPVDTSDAIGVRNIISAEEIEHILAVLHAASSKMPDNWNRRYRENMEKLKTGDLVEVAEVVRNLTRTERHKKLSAGEKKMLTNARQILLSEIVLAGDMDAASADILIDEAV
ncbi:CarD family transcriptional regulator [Zhenpiania hominis]|uniref:CarD family transcriptional regulator n=1 Tax=Zhenpiania hominis TaxID=2763644 RepID=A0A923NMF5_9FIRM|nr:CarD family transcriptional regulator [Zhenpiania hominis]MBC6680640.1 CarD family transcriptional regulator [Zhenpiania hominis]